jgi:hypothetical protein
MAESEEIGSPGNPREFVEKAKLKGRLSRADLLDYASSVFQLSFEKIYARNTSAPDKLAWARIITGMTAAVSPILRDTELDDLKKDVESIKQRIFEKG